VERKQSAEFSGPQILGERLLRLDRRTERGDDSRYISNQEMADKQLDKQLDQLQLMLSSS
jgi:hypothetical protein